MYVVKDCEGIIISYFSDNYDKLKYPVYSDSKAGLRNSQSGAIHAIASYATLGSKKAAIIVMPTGSGKTTVLMMAPYILKRKKVLIVTPSAMVRSQITKDFKLLCTLKAINVFQKNVKAPKIYEAKHLYKNEDDNKILSSDVIIATPMIAKSISENDIKNEFDYLIFDEAHHVPAPTWQKIIKNMMDIPILLVTATPFRLDNKQIKGEIIYNYPLSQAIKDKIYGKVRFVPVNDDKDKNKDICIAEETERIYLKDKKAGYNHFVLVRTNTKEKARELEKIYSDSTKLKLKRIDSAMSSITIDNIIKQLKKNQIQGLICINMLGEGFDFPNLKIAAIHEPHKSLASTLQFIGRFSRTNADDIGDATFIAMNNQDLQIENNRLYSSDVAWQKMIINMSDEKVDRVLESNKAIGEFSSLDDSDMDLSVHCIKVKGHAKVYKVSNFYHERTFPIDKQLGNFVYTSKCENTVIGISEIDTKPLWSSNDNLFNKEYRLYIVHYQPSTKLLFIYSQNKLEGLYNSIVENFSKDYELIPREYMNRVLAGFTNYEFFNTGMQNRYSEGGEAYRVYSGFDTAKSIDEVSGKMLSAGHAFCRVSDKNKVYTIGYSSGSKFWSSSYLTIPEYIRWCEDVGIKIGNKDLKVKTNTNYDKLPIPKKIIEYSTGPLFCFLNNKVYISPCRIYKKDNPHSIALITDITLKFLESNSKTIKFEVQIFGVSEKIICDINGKYSSENSLLYCKVGSNTYTLAEYFSENPISFKTSDDTVYYGSEVLEGNLELEKYDLNRIKTINWKKLNIDITSECITKKEGKLSIQDGLKTYLLNNPNFTFIIFDHGSGEIADFITLKDSETSVDVEFYHCKAMKGSEYNSSVNDVYEVAQQAVKSTIWIKSKAVLLEKINNRISGSDKEKFIKGNLEDLKTLLTSSKVLKVKIYIVQPAIKKSKDMPEKIGSVLSAATAFVKRTGVVQELLVLGSE